MATGLGEAHTGHPATGKKRGLIGRSPISICSTNWGTFRLSPVFLRRVREEPDLSVAKGWGTHCDTSERSQSPQEGDKSFAIFRGKPQPEGVPPHSIGLGAVWFESSRHVIFLHTPRVKPVLQGGTPTAMPKHAAIPYAPQGGNFVITSAPSGFKSQIRIGANREREDGIFLGSIHRGLKPNGER